MLTMATTISSSTIVKARRSSCRRFNRPGRRLQCANNLRQFGIAMHLHEDGNGHLPSGATSFGPQFSRMTWLTRTLPYLEKTDVWDNAVAAWDYQPSPFFDPPHLGLSTPIPLFSCPSDGPRSLLASPWRGRIMLDVFRRRRGDLLSSGAVPCSFGRSIWLHSFAWLV